MNCLICFKSLKQKYINYTCVCGYSHTLHNNCFKQWCKKKGGNYCLICLTLIDTKVKKVNKKSLCF